MANLKQNSSKIELSSPSGSYEPLGPVAVNIAKYVSLSPATYKRAKFIIENGTEQQKQKLREGTARINTEYKCLQHVKNRNEMIAEAQSSKVLDEFFKDNPDQKIRLLLGDMREQSKHIPDNSADLIFTDPPYAIEYLPLYAEIGRLAVRVLKPGASMVVYHGHQLLFKAGNLVEESSDFRLKFIHQHIVLHSGQRKVLLAYHTGVKYKSLLWFVKGDSPNNGSLSYNDDVIVSDPVAKEYHKWQQSPVEAEHMISKLTVENQVVLDPFLGGGTTAIAALKLKRKFIGIEIEQDTFNIAKSRIASFLKTGPEIRQ